MNDKKSIIITVDGSSAVGKGTLAKRLAEHFNFDHMDTGALYRMTALKMIRQGEDLEDEMLAKKAAETLDYDEYLSLIDDPELRTNEMGTHSTTVACIPSVRQALLDVQRNFAYNPPNGRGAVLDGRDIGTTVIPDADYKFYLNARPEIKAERRYKELQEKGMEADYDDILKRIVERDKKNQERSFGQEKAAEDGLIIDTSDLSRDEVFERALVYIKSNC